MTTGWEVIYNDETVLKQFKDDGKENSFSDIKQDEIFEFRVYHNGKILSLFMPTGTFGFNGLLYDTDKSRIQDANYRLIHFARRQKVMGVGNETNKYFVGFQITQDGNNHKRMVSICDNQIQLITE